MDNLIGFGQLALSWEEDTKGVLDEKIHCR